MSILRTDLLDPTITETPDAITIHPRFEDLIRNASFPPDKSRTPNPSKSLREFFELVDRAIKHSELRENIIESARIFFTEEDPDILKSERITIVFSVEKSLPGAHGQGRPFEGEIRNMKPILREELDDTENPGYKRAVMGYCYDTEVKFTIFARTNKTANIKVDWFQDLMLEYDWYFASQGVNRCMFLRRSADIVIKESDVKMYGRPVHYFVRTERLTSISQKKLEEISIGVDAYDLKT